MQQRLCRFLYVVNKTPVLKSQHEYSREKIREKNKKETNKEKKKEKLIFANFKINDFFFYLGFHSRTFTIPRTAGKGEGIYYLTPLYHFHPLHKHLDNSSATTAESSSLDIARSRTQTGNLWFPSANLYLLSYAPSLINPDDEENSYLVLL